LAQRFFWCGADAADAKIRLMVQVFVRHVFPVWVRVKVIA
jgi:hypothetical protein